MERERKRKRDNKTFDFQKLYHFSSLFKKLHLSLLMILVVDDDDDSLDPSYSLDLMILDSHLDTSSSLDFEIVTFEHKIQRYLNKKKVIF